MITLSGYTVKDNNNLDGDIEIKVIGLRPGEKLYEELLIGDNPQKTIHPKILKAEDKFITYSLLRDELKHLKILLESHNAFEVKNLLNKLVKLFKSNSDIVDHVYKEQTLNKNTDNALNVKKIK